MTSQFVLTFGREALTLLLMPPLYRRFGLSPLSDNAGAA